MELFDLLLAWLNSPETEDMSILFLECNLLIVFRCRLLEPGAEILVYDRLYVCGLGLKIKFRFEVPGVVGCLDRMEDIVLGLA